MQKWRTRVRERKAQVLSTERAAASVVGDRPEKKMEAALASAGREVALEHGGGPDRVRAQHASREPTWKGSICHSGRGGASVCP